jgi:hypothetical protein
MKTIMNAEQAAAYIAGKDAQLSLLERCRTLAERVLASQGDAAEPELVTLQHDLTTAAMLRRRDLCSPANTSLSV